MLSALLVFRDVDQRGHHHLGHYDGLWQRFHPAAEKLRFGCRQWLGRHVLDLEVRLVFGQPRNRQLATSQAANVTDDFGNVTGLRGRC